MKKMHPSLKDQLKSLITREIGRPAMPLGPWDFVEIFAILVAIFLLVFLCWLCQTRIGSRPHRLPRPMEDLPLFRRHQTRRDESAMGDIRIFPHRTHSLVTT